MAAAEKTVSADGRALNLVDGMAESISIDERDAELREAPRVLLVDDDEQLARVMKLRFAKLGFDVEVATDGEHALRALAESAFDVMILDLRMSGMDGLELLRRAPQPGLPPTIVHSAYLDVPTTVVAMRAGVVEVLEKPAPTRTLAERVRQVAALGHQSPRVSGMVPAVGKAPHGLLLGNSPAMDALREAIRGVARFHDISVLVEGPTGTGKEVVAQAVHEASAPAKPFVCVNCAAIPSELFESELFGHDAGAFTSARGSRSGLLEEAANGTLFLDEVGELPLALQPKLLRVLETRQFRRVGSNRVRQFRGRVVSATNRQLIDEPGFRSDLYFRIAGYRIQTPALKDHAADIPLLAEHFLGQFAARHGIGAQSVAGEALQYLRGQAWPGNVRQLRAVLESAAVLAQGEEITLDHLRTMLARTGAESAGGAHDADSASFSSEEARTLPGMEKEMILRAFEDEGRNLSRAARKLGIPRTTLRDRLRRYGVR